MSGADRSTKIYYLHTPHSHRWARAYVQGPTMCIERESVQFGDYFLVTMSDIRKLLDNLHHNNQSPIPSGNNVSVCVTQGTLHLYRDKGEQRVNISFSPPDMQVFLERCLSDTPFLAHYHDVLAGYYNGKLVFLPPGSLTYTLPLAIGKMVFAESPPLIVTVKEQGVEVALEFPRGRSDPEETSLRIRYINKQRIVWDADISLVLWEGLRSEIVKW